MVLEALAIQDAEVMVGLRCTNVYFVKSSNFLLKSKHANKGRLIKGRLFFVFFHPSPGTRID